MNTNNFPFVCCENLATPPLEHLLTLSTSTTDIILYMLQQSVVLYWIVQHRALNLIHVLLWTICYYLPPLLILFRLSVCGATISCIILDCSAQGSQFNTCALNNSPRTLFSWTLVVDEITSLVSDTTSGVFVTMRGTLCFAVTAMLGNQSKWVKKYILITNTNRIHLCTRPSTLPCPKYVDTYKDYTHMYCNC